MVVGTPRDALPMLKDRNKTRFEFHGQQFRVQNSEVLKAQMAALGGSPQPMAFSEVYGALQTGVVDGQENT